MFLMQFQLFLLNPSLPYNISNSEGTRVPFQQRAHRPNPARKDFLFGYGVFFSTRIKYVRWKT
jgi:hypothetical protein